MSDDLAAYFALVAPRIGRARPDPRSPLAREPDLARFESAERALAAGIPERALAAGMPARELRGHHTRLRGDDE